MAVLQNGTIQIQAQHLQGAAFPVQLTLMGCNTSQVHTIFSTPYLVEVPEPCTYQLDYVDANRCFATTTATVGQSTTPPDNNNDTPTTFATIQNAAECTDSGKEITPYSVLTQGWEITDVYLLTGQGTVSHNLPFTSIFYHPPANYVGVTMIEFVATKDNVVKKGKIEITVSCENGLTTDGSAPNPVFDLLCVSTTTNILPTFPSGWTLVNVNGSQVQYGTLHYDLPNNSITYAPKNNTTYEDGAVQDILTWTATDEYGVTQNGTITVNVDCPELIAPPLTINIACDDAMPIQIFNQERELAVFNANPSIPFAATNAKTNVGNTPKPINFYEVEQGGSGSVGYVSPTAGGLGFEYTLNDVNANSDTMLYHIQDSGGNQATGAITINIDTADCANCDLDIEAEYCQGGFIRVSGYNIDADPLQVSYTYQDGDRVAVQFGIPNDGSQNLATTEIEFLEGQGHNLVDADNHYYTLDAIGDFVKLKYRAVSTCSGHFTEWVGIKIERNSGGNGIQTSWFNPDTGQSIGGSLVIDSYVKINIPSNNTPTITQAGFELIDPDNPDAVQNINLQNLQGQPAGIGNNVNVSTQTLMSKHVGGTGGKLRGFILIDGCESLIETDVIDLPMFLG